MLKTEIEDMLLSIGGINPSRLGFGYIVDAVLLTIQEPYAIRAITKQLYPTVAKRNKTTASRVERAIRAAIRQIYLEGDMDHIQKVFGNISRMDSGVPTNGAFIATLALKMQRSIENGGSQ